MKEGIGVALFSIVVLFAVSLAVHAGDQESEPNEKPELFCPKTKISDNDRCMDCHVIPDFALKEIKPNNRLDIPTNANVHENVFTYYMDGAVEYGSFRRAVEWLRWHPQYNEIVIELHSPGGSLATAWKLVGMLEGLRSQGYHITTRVEGFAASAAFIIFQAGDIREIGPLAETMHHELWTVTWLSVDTPSSKEDEAKVLRHLQTTVHKWLVTRCSKPITVEELDDLVHKKDYWMNSEDVLEAGFADRYIGE